VVRSIGIVTNTHFIRWRKPEYPNKTTFDNKWQIWFVYVIVFGYVCLLNCLYIFCFNRSLIDDRSLFGLYFNKNYLLTYLLASIWHQIYIYSSFFFYIFTFFLHTMYWHFFFTYLQLSMISQLRRTDRVIYLWIIHIYIYSNYYIIYKYSKIYVDIFFTYNVLTFFFYIFTIILAYIHTTRLLLSVSMNKL
jgi:hypothetical protein